MRTHISTLFDPPHPYPCPHPQVQGTMLMHISTLVKYDAQLGSEWLKHFKAGGLAASPFLLQARGGGGGLGHVHAATVACCSAHC
jgi:hypothetical protein